MLEAYGTGTGVAIGVTAVTAPLLLTFMAFFAGGPGSGKSALKVVAIGEGLGLAAALGAVYYLGARKGTVGRGILYGLAVPAALGAASVGVNVVAHKFPAFGKTVDSAIDGSGSLLGWASHSRI